MASTYSPKLRFELIGAGEQAGLWGSTTNKNVGQLIEQAIAGVTTVVLDGLSGNYTLTALDGAPDQSRSAVIKCIQTAVPAAGAINLIIPTQTKLYVVRNDCGQTVTVKTSAQVGGVVILDGESTLVFCDGSEAQAGIETAAVGTLTVSGGGTGSTTFTAGFVKSPGGTGALTSSSTVNAATELSNQVPVANGGTNIASYTAGDILYASGSTTLTKLPIGSSGQVLTVSGGGIPSWAATSGAVTSVTGSGINVSPTTGAVVVTLTGTNVTNALGYTPANSSSVPTLSGSNSFSGSNTFSSTVVINPSNGSSSNLCLGASSIPSSAWNFYSKSQNAQVAVAVEANGSGAVGIAGLSNSTNNWAAWYQGSISGPNLVGRIYFNGVNTVVYDGAQVIAPSDYRLKDNITPLGSSINKLKALKPVSFTWKKDVKAEIQEGFIAHEFAEVIPSGVTGEKDAVDEQGNIKQQGINMSSVIPMLTKALQEAVARIEALEAEVAALKGN
jgi:hypothetical protein